MAVPLTNRRILGGRIGHPEKDAATARNGTAPRLYTNTANFKVQGLGVRRGSQKAGCPQVEYDL